MTPLEKSIEHWRKNTAAPTFREASIKASDCALCLKFNNELEGSSCEGCIGCPVMVATGLSTCRKTPYTRALPLYDRWVESSNNSELADAKRFRAAAKDELEFLISLLPEKGSHA